MESKDTALFVHVCNNCSYEFIANTTINICPECDEEMINPVKDEITAIVNWNEEIAERGNI